MDKPAWADSVSDGILSAPQFRSDIDGLRAIAVSAVIAYHFWNDLLPGGFLGVDMFFVISGHVITASLSKHAGSVQELFVDFYCRRIKRLLPTQLFEGAIAPAHPPPSWRSGRCAERPSEFPRPRPVSHHVPRRRLRIL
jgi:hypothetical protein